MSEHHHLFTGTLVLGPGARQPRLTCQCGAEYIPPTLADAAAAQERITALEKALEEAQMNNAVHHLCDGQQEELQALLARYEAALKEISDYGITLGYQPSALEMRSIARQALHSGEDRIDGP